MDTVKKIGSILLAFALVITPVSLNAVDLDDDMDIMDEDVNAAEVQDYITYEGHIVAVNDDMSIWVQKEGDKGKAQEGIIFNLDEDLLLLSDKSMGELSSSYLEKDMKVLVFYKADTPMTMSLPPQATPYGIVVLENEEPHFTKIAKFNDELVSMDNKLKLNIQEDTPMIDREGDKIEKEDLKDENLLVFYAETTKSIPAQTNPHKVILLEDLDWDLDIDFDFDEDITVFDKMLIDREDEEDITIGLENQLYRNEKNVLMVPLRAVGEALDYEITWDAEKRAATLTKGAQWTEVVIGEGTVGEDNYNFAKMIVKLGNPPVLKDSKLYVPVNFIKEVLQRDIDIEDGMLQIEE